MLLDSWLVRQRRLETFLNFPRGSLEVCGAVCPLVSLDNRADQRALCVPPEGTVGMRCTVAGWTTDITARLVEPGAEGEEAGQPCCIFRGGAGTTAAHMPEPPPPPPPPAFLEFSYV